MRNILLITDLSDAALAGALEAAALASRQQMRLILVYNFVPEPETGPVAPDEEQVRLPAPELAVQQKLDALAQRLHLVHGTSVTRLVKPELNAAALAQLARQVNAEQVLQVGAANLAKIPVSLA